MMICYRYSLNKRVLRLRLKKLLSHGGYLLALSMNSAKATKREPTALAAGGFFRSAGAPDASAFGSQVADLACKALSACSQISQFTSTKSHPHPLIPSNPAYKNPVQFRDSLFTNGDKNIDYKIRPSEASEKAVWKTRNQKSEIINR